jgi:hypothetical protein
MAPTENEPTTPARRRRRARAIALPSITAAVLSLLPSMGSAGAQSFLDPADPCPPGVEVVPAPVSDRDQIAPVHLLNVDCAFALGISIGIGTTPNTFGPGAMTTRGHMASFIVNALEAAGYDLPAPSNQGFTDIAGNPHEDNINRLAAADITLGVTPTMYQPGTFVPRDQMASFLVRSAEFAFEDSGFEAQEPSPFTDVPSANVHGGNIAAAFEVLGLTVGRTPETYGPKEPTRRDQMATFLVRLVDITLIVE